MTNIELSVKNKIAKVISTPPVVCGNTYTVHVEFDDEWTDVTNLVAKVRFKGEFYDIPFSGDTFTMSIPSNILQMTVGIYSDSLKTTSGAIINVTPSILCGKDGVLVEFDGAMYEQFLENISEMLVDQTIDGTSNHAVANRVVVDELDKKVSKSGAETISGEKTFQGNIIHAGNEERGIITRRLDKALGDSWCRFRWDRVRDSNTFTVAEYIVVGDSNAMGSTILSRTKNSSGTNVEAKVEVLALVDGTTYATAPTPSNAMDDSTKIVTTEWVNNIDNDVVHKSRAEIITGKKTFNSNIVTPQHDVTYMVTPNSSASDAPYYCLAEVPLKGQGSYNKSMFVATAYENNYFSNQMGYAQLRINVQYDSTGAFQLASFFMVESKAGLMVHDPNNWTLVYNQEQDKMQLWVKHLESQTNVFLSVDARVDRKGLFNNWTLLPKSSGVASLPSTDDGWVHVSCEDVSNLLATSTPSDAVGTEIATAEWVLDKIATLEARIAELEGGA